MRKGKRSKRYQPEDFECVECLDTDIVVEFYDMTSGLVSHCDDGVLCAMSSH